MFDSEKWSIIHVRRWFETMRSSFMFQWNFEHSKHDGTDIGMQLMELHKKECQRIIEKNIGKTQKGQGQNGCIFRFVFKTIK